MAVLANHAPLSAKELAERTAMNQVGITRALGELMQVGMVRRRTDAKDRRRVVLRLSDKGVAAYREVIPIAIRMEAELLKGIRPQEAAQLRATMTRLARHAESLFGGDRDWRNFQPGRGGTQ
ncbi:MAG: MarR family transcriptional regulator [Betaproteobacteria bacterium]|nr:MarR family transcriptional regulator [Betaproteobacteria bacterium]